MGFTLSAGFGIEASEVCEDAAWSLLTWGMDLLNPGEAGATRYTARQRKFWVDLMCLERP